MSSVIWMVVRGLMVALVITLLLALPWTDISPYLVYVQQFVNYVMIADPFIDTDALFTAVKIILVVEMILIGFRRVLLPLFHFVSSGSFTGGGGVVDNSGEQS